MRKAIIGSIWLARVIRAGKIALPLLAQSALDRYQVLRNIIAAAKKRCKLRYRYRFILFGHSVGGVAFFPIKPPPCFESDLIAPSKRDGGSC